MLKQLMALALTTATHAVLRLAHKSRSHATRQRLRTLAGMIRPCRSPRVLAVAITLPLSLPMPVVAESPAPVMPTLAAITVTVPPPVVIIEAANWTAQPMPETSPAPTAPKKRGRPRKQLTMTTQPLTKGK